MPAFLKYTAFAGALLICAGLQFSPALQSIGVALIFLHPFLNGQTKLIWPALRQNKTGLLLIAYYLIIFLSIFYTTDYKVFWQQNAEQKLPFLLLPIGLSAGANFTDDLKRYVLYFFITVVWFIATATFINYLIHFDEINAQIIHSKPIPIITGISHIYFSAMLAFTVCIAMYFGWAKKPKRNWEKWIIRGIFLTCLIYLHTISARTGLLAFYAAVLAWIILYMWRSRKMLPGLIIFLGVCLLLVVSLKFIPSLNNRLANTQTDLEHMAKGEDIKHYSISMRIEALQTAVKVYLTSPIIGVGPADIKQEMLAQRVKDNSPLLEGEYKELLPHNQFLQTLVMLGIAGFLTLISFFIYPVLKRKKHFSDHSYMALFWLFLLIMFFSFQVESMLERQIGLTFFCLFYLLLPLKNEYEV